MKILRIIILCLISHQPVLATPKKTTGTPSLACLVQKLIRQKQQDILDKKKEITNLQQTLNDSRGINRYFDSQNLDVAQRVLTSLEHQQNNLKKALHISKQTIIPVERYTA